MTCEPRAHVILILNHRGSAVVEQIFSMGVMIGVVAGFLYFAVIGASKIWLRYAGNEAAICLASDATRSRCETDFRRRTQILERVGHMKNFELSTTPTAASVRWNFQIKGYGHAGLELGGNVNLALPLQGSSKGWA